MGCNKCEKKFCSNKVPILKDLSCDEMDEITKRIEHKEYLKGKILFQEGEKAQALYILKQGKLKLYKYTKEGKEQILHILGEGEFFGENNLLQETPFEYYAKAIMDCQVCTLKKDTFRQLMLQKPEISLKVLEVMGDRLNQLEKLMVVLVDNDGDAKLAYLLIELAERYGGDLPITREDMASYTGLTRETISRKLRGFTEQGLIKMVGHKKIEILDYEALKQMI